MRSMVQGKIQNCLVSVEDYLLLTKTMMRQLSNEEGELSAVTAWLL